jgi:RNA recognition motif-containing protein
MDDDPGASQAVSELNGSNCKGRTLKVEKSESKGPRKPSQKMFVGKHLQTVANLPYRYL